MLGYDTRYDTTTKIYTCYLRDDTILPGNTFYSAKAKAGSLAAIGS